MALMFIKSRFQENEIVTDSKGTEWIIVRYEMGMVLVAPNNKEAEKTYGRVYMPEYDLFKKDSPK